MKIEELTFGKPMTMRMTFAILGVVLFFAACGPRAPDPEKDPCGGPCTGEVELRIWFPAPWDSANAVPESWIDALEVYARDRALLKANEQCIERDPQCTCEGGRFARGGPVLIPRSVPLPNGSILEFTEILVPSEYIGGTCESL